MLNFFSGSLPSETGAHKCSVCNIPVHALPSCSTHILGKYDVRICFTCSKAEDDDSNDEDKVCENWNRQNKNQRKSKSYLVPNPHLRFLNLDSNKNNKSLPILKNGSRFKELKSCKIKSITGKVILSNTCAFDTLASLIMVSNLNFGFFFKLICILSY